jgi:hypothetical protein
VRGSSSDRYTVEVCCCVGESDRSPGPALVVVDQTAKASPAPVAMASSSSSSTRRGYGDFGRGYDDGAVRATRR